MRHRSKPSPASPSAKTPTPRQVLHPRLAEWFASRFPRFSDAQRLALPHTLKGENTLILAPTGSGKTLAAFLSILNDLAKRQDQGRGGLPNQVLAVYVSPLRSLTRDIERNLAGPLAALGEGIRMEVRTGDTEMSARSRMARLRPHLLLTTPESLSSLLSQTPWRGAFADGTVAVVDEIHSFAESKRGSLLALTLERLNPRQRIGLSATAHPVAAVQGLLCGARACAVAAVDGTRTHELQIARVPSEISLPAAGYCPYRIAHVVAAAIANARCSLVFTSTRSAAERLGLALQVLLPQTAGRVEVHHASIDREKRLAIEEDLARGELKACVCSTSLEMGVDFQAVDQVLLIGAPRGVSRALQRLGRSGHRIGGVARGSLVPLSLPDLLECIALREAARGGRLDSQRPPRAPLDVLAQVLLGMAVEREWTAGEAFDLVRRAGPYRDLARKDFDDVLDYLAGGGRVLAGYGETYGKIVLTDGRFRAASRKVSQSFYRNIGTISDDFQVKVVARGNRQLGRVEESFVGSLQPHDAFVIGGKSVRLRSWHGDTATVEPAAGERVKTPRWMAGKMSLTARLAAEVRALRRKLRDAPDVAAMLCAEYGVDRDTAERVVEFTGRQRRAAPIPVDDPVQLECVLQGRALLLIFHVVAGRAVNRSLAWVAGRRLGMDGGSVVSNFNDDGFLLSVAASNRPGADRLRECFDPHNWTETLREALEATETLGRKFRSIAETGQLLERRNLRGPARHKASSWNGSLLYQTFLRHEPDHPLVREAVREVLEDELDCVRAAGEAARIFESRWEVFDLERPSPFSLTLFAPFNREVLVAQDPDKALDELTAGMYESWA